MKNMIKRLAHKHDCIMCVTDFPGELLEKGGLYDFPSKRYKSLTPSNSFDVSFEMVRELRR